MVFLESMRRFFPGWHSGRRWYHLSFRLQVLLLVGILLSGMLLTQGSYLNYRKADLVRIQMGERALAVAKSVSAMLELSDAMLSADPSAVIQPLAERIRLDTGARYVVVGNANGIRYAHPVPERIGFPMEGGDNEGVLLRGQTYVSEAEGTLGRAMRGKTPIFDRQGRIVGVVSVGFTADHVAMDVGHYTYFGWLLIGSMVVLGFVGAYGLSRHLKRVILGLEPHEIARLLMEKEAILQSIHEGVLAVNHEGEITLINQQARRLLDLPDSAGPGQPLQQVVPDSRLLNVLRHGERESDQEVWLGDHPVVTNRVPIIHDGVLEGAVATFRSRREILNLSQALSRASQDVSLLRAQAHEFSNKLHTLSGLLQLGRIDEALAMIHQESHRVQAQMSFLLRQVADPVLSGILLGKLNRAAELGVLLELDEHCCLSRPLTGTGQEVLMSVVGNLLDNACHAALQGGSAEPRVRLFFTDIGQQLLIEVDDNGPGVLPEHAEAIFTEGFSTKTGQHRGIGLPLVARLCKRHGGSVVLEASELGGACFIAVLDVSLCVASA